MRVRGIPPITSTGVNRRKSPARFDGLAHMSIGRYMSERARNIKEEEHDSWNIEKFAKSAFNNKSEKKASKPAIYVAGPKINCSVSIIESYKESDIAITLKFNDIVFLGDSQPLNSTGIQGTAFFIPVSINKSLEVLFLKLTTIGDIFEYEIVRDIKYCACSDENCFAHMNAKSGFESKEKKFCPNRIFCDEVFIPSLLEKYNPLSMRVLLKENTVVVTYKNK